MKVELRYFASIREALGAGETIDVFEGTTLGALRDSLIARGGPHAEVLARGRAVRVALDRTLRDEAVVIAPSGSSASVEVAFFPPVTGG